MSSSPESTAQALLDFLAARSPADRATLLAQLHSAERFALARALDAAAPASWWFERHCFVRTTDQRVIPYRMRPVQREFERDLTGRDIVCKARKHGISTHIAARFYRYVTTRCNVAAALVAHKPDSTQELWRIIQLFMLRDPRRLRTRYASRHEVFFEDLNSYFVVLQAGPGSGRGGTYNYLHISELAHFAGEPVDTLAGMIAAVPPRELGSEIIIESTANGEGNEFHRRFVAAVQGESDYAAHFFAWHEHPEHVRSWKPNGGLDGDEQKLQAKYGLTLEQIAFRRAMVSDIGRDLFRQEYPLTWHEAFLASGRKVFDREALAALQAELERPPIRVGENGALAIWVPPKRGRRYTAGVDTAEGVLGGDYQDVRILDFESMEEVARLRGHWPIHVLARKAASLINAYQAFTVVEKNNHGHAVLEHWLRGEDEARVPRDRLYHHRAYDRSGKQLRKPGWETNSKTKPIAIADLEEAIRRHHLRAHDRTFYLEARAFAYDESGNTGAPLGGHDDAVMAMALAVQGRKHGPGEAGYSSRPAVFGL